MATQTTQKVDKVVLGWLIVFLSAIGALYYFGYTSSWGAELLNGFGDLMLVWGVLSPLYVLIRMGIVALQRRKAGRLGLTYAEYMARRHPHVGDVTHGQHPVVHRWKGRLLRIAVWELAVATALFVLFGLAAEHSRHQAGEHVGITAIGMLYALTLYFLIGLQLLHRAWAQWHHRLVPGSLAPADPPLTASLTTSKKVWNTLFLLALLFALVELAMTGEETFLTVLMSFLVPGIGLLLLITSWGLLRRLFPHKRTETA